MQLAYYSTTLQNYPNHLGSRIRELIPFYSYASFPPSFGIVVDSIDNLDVSRMLHLHL
jgi:hypothetical protein